MKTVNIDQKFSTITDYWKPGVIASFNDYELRLAKIKGEFDWHYHENSDELFIVYKGSFKMEFRNESFTLLKGDVFVVPKGVEHRPVAIDECEIMMIEPSGT